MKFLRENQMIRKLTFLIVLITLAFPLRAQTQVPIVSGAVTIDVSQSNAWKVILTANVTSLTLRNPQPGQIISVLFTQDATGGRTVTFGGNIVTTLSVTSTASASTLALFQYDGNTNTWFTISGGASSGAVSSVFTRTGAVVAATNDYSLSQIALTPLTNGQLLYDNSGAPAGVGSYNNSTLLFTLPGGVATTASGGYGGFIASPEGTVGNGTLGANAAAGTDVCYASSTAHAYLCSFNNSSFLPMLIGTAHAISTTLTCAAASASGTAYTCTTSPTFTPVDGDVILFQADVANTGAATLNVNSSSAAPIKKQGGGTALIANDFLASQDSLMEFDGVNWQMQGQPGNAAGGGSGVVLVPATTAANIIAPTAASVVPLTVLQTTGTAADMFDVCIPSAGACGTKEFYLDSTGNVFAANTIYESANLRAGQNVLVGINAVSVLQFSNLGDHINTDAGTAANTDIQGVIAISSATSASKTFTTAYTNAPVCTITPISDPTATGVWWVTTTTTTVTANVKTSGTISFNYTCIAHGS
jgi:hypothetical protein